MKNSFLRPVLVKTMLLVLSFISVFTLSSKAGGIVFEIYLNDKLLLKQQYHTVVAGSPNLQLGEANSNDNLRIFFTSCGVSGKTRSVGIRDENNKLLKEWTFTNSSSSDLSMTIPVKEILAIQKSKSASSLKLYYFSPEQFKDGQMLASVQTDKKNTAYQPAEKTSYWPTITAAVFTLAALGIFLRRNA